MKYIALLRGINVGGHHMVEMKRLKALMESMGYCNVRTYLNSGNVLFETNDDRRQIQEAVPKALEVEFGFEIATLIKSEEDMKRIASVIPLAWENNQEQKTDVAYLFPEVDYEGFIDEMPVKREFADLLYVPGAVVWHIFRDNYNKSQINKIIGQKMYQQMTVRNVNTARYLAGQK